MVKPVEGQRQRGHVRLLNAAFHTPQGDVIPLPRVEARSQGAAQTAHYRSKGGSASDEWHFFKASSLYDPDRGFEAAKRLRVTARGGDCGYQRNAQKSGNVVTGLDQLLREDTQTKAKSNVSQVPIMTHDAIIMEVGSRSGRQHPEALSQQVERLAHGAMASMASRQIS